MNHRRMRMGALGLALALSVSMAACGDTGKEDKQDAASWLKQQEENLGEFYKAGFPMEMESAMILDLPENNLLKEELNLGVLTAKDGVFYSLGHGPSADGYKDKSMAVFGFDGVSMEARGVGSIVMDFVPPQEGMTYHYMQFTGEELQFIRADLDSFTEEILAAWSDEDGQPDPFSPYYCYDDWKIYYIKDESDGFALYRQTFGWGEQRLTSLGSSRPLEMELSHGDAYILTEDEFYMYGDLDVDRVELDFTPIGRMGTDLYYVDGEGYLTVFEAGSRRDGEHPRTQIAKVDVERFAGMTYDRDFIRDGFCYYTDKNGFVTALDVVDGQAVKIGKTDQSFRCYSMNRHEVLMGDGWVSLWDREEKEIALFLKGNDFGWLWQNGKDSYILPYEDGLLIFDEERKGVYDVWIEDDYGTIIAFDGECLYGRWEAEWFNEEGETDIYYRLAVTQRR